MGVKKEVLDVVRESKDVPLAVVEELQARVNQLENLVRELFNRLGG